MLEYNIHSLSLIAICLHVLLCNSNMFESTCPIIFMTYTHYPLIMLINIIIHYPVISIVYNYVYMCMPALSTREKYITLGAAY